MVNHPSGLEDDGELAYVSAEFWMTYPTKKDMTAEEIREAYSCLLSFQQGWKACKDFYKSHE